LIAAAGIGAVPTRAHAFSKRTAARALTFINCVVTTYIAAGQGKHDKKRTAEKPPKRQLAGHSGLPYNP
jgi:hypothetical protein